MKRAGEGVRGTRGTTRREVLKVGVMVAAGAVLPIPRSRARVASPNPGPRIRVRPLRREDLRPDPDLAG